MSVDIKVQGLTKLYGKNIALDHIDLEIKKGEFVCLLGPSGCGKSTLLRLIAGLDQPDEGKIYIGGKDATKMAASKRNFGIVFQSYALFPNLTAFENVAYGLRNRKIPSRNMEEIVNRLFDVINLSTAKGRYPAQLSGGEQQRVALARALAIEPDFLLLDEPLSALDAKVRLKLRKEICAIQRKMGLTTIMVTHDQDEALTMADRIIVMNKATVMQEGTPLEIYQQPKTPFVADFIGSINFLDYPPVRRKEWERAEIEAIRPEKIELRPAYDTGVIAGRIDHVEFRGSHYRLSVKRKNYAEGAEILIDVPFLQAQEYQLARGKDIYFTLPREQILQFSQW